MISDSDTSEDYLTVKDDLNAVPDNINTMVAEISQKELLLKNLAKKCRIQVNEVRQRTSTLNNYAKNLLVIDTNIKKEKNLFTQELNSHFAELNEMENELNEELESYETHKNENEKRISIIESMKKQTNESCQENEENIKILTDKAEEMNKQEIPDEDDAVPYEVIQVYKNKIAKNKEKVSPIEKEIEKQNSVINSINNDLQSVCSQLEEVNKERADIRATVKETNEKHMHDIYNIKRKTNKAKKNINSLNQLSLDLEAHSTSLKTRAARIQKRIDHFSKREIKFNNALDTEKEKSQHLINNLNDAKEQVKQYKDAYDRRKEFYKNIDISNQRAKNRTNEITTELKTTREIQKKTEIEQFEVEMKIEKCEEQEKDLNEEIEKIEQEASIVEKEENQSICEFGKTQDEISQYETEEKEYQKNVEMLIAKKKEAKEKVVAAHEDEKQLIEAYRRVKAGLNYCNDPAIQKELKSNAIFVDGYKAKLQFINDSIKSLQTQIKTEELKNAFNNSEYKRSTTMFTNLSSQMIQSPTVTRVAKDMNAIKTEISGLESVIKEKRTKIKVLEETLNTKSKTQIEEVQETNYQEALNQRTKIANSFISQAEKLLVEIKKAKEDFSEGDENLRDIIKINSWNDMISKMVDEAEEIEIEAELV